MEFVNEYKKLGQLIEYLESMGRELETPIDPEVHVERLKSSIPELTAEFKNIFSEITGQNPWK